MGIIHFLQVINHNQFTYISIIIKNNIEMVKLLIEYANQH